MYYSFRILGDFQIFLGESIYGGTFEDEEFVLKHDRPFLLSMANRGKNTNGSQFFVTTAPAQHLDGLHVIFGQVVQGKEVVKAIEDLDTDRKDRPLQDARIVNCGELIRKIKKKRDVSSSASVEESSSPSSSESVSSEDEKKKKKKKKDKKKKKKSKKNKKKDSEQPEEGELICSSLFSSPCQAFSRQDFLVIKSIFFRIFNYIYFQVN